MSVVRVTHARVIGGCEGSGSLRYERNPPTGMTMKPFPGYTSGPACLVHAAFGNQIRSAVAIYTRTILQEKWELWVARLRLACTGIAAPLMAAGQFTLLVHPHRVQDQSMGGRATSVRNALVDENGLFPKKSR